MGRTGWRRTVSWEGAGHQVEFAPHRGVGVWAPALPRGMCDPERTASRSLVSFMNKINTVIHSGPSYQIDLCEDIAKYKF